MIFLLFQTGVDPPNYLAFWAVSLQHLGHSGGRNSWDATTWQVILYVGKKNVQSMFERDISNLHLKVFSCNTGHSWITKLWWRHPTTTTYSFASSSSSMVIRLLFSLLYGCENRFLPPFFLVHDYENPWEVGNMVMVINENGWMMEWKILSVLTQGISIELLRICKGKTLQWSSLHLQIDII